MASCLSGIAEYDEHSNNLFPSLEEATKELEDNKHLWRNASYKFAER